MRFLKHLFTVPEGEKVTDRHLKRVLISSVCGILVCLTCLMSSTWAWYTATVEAPITPITVSSHKAVVYRNGSTEALAKKESVLVEKDESVAVRVVFETDADPSQDVFSTEDKLGYTPGRYIVLSVYRQIPPAEPDGEPTYSYVGSYCFPATKVDNGWELSLTLTSAENCKVAFSTAWQAPLTAKVVNEVPAVFTVINQTMTLEETSEPTENSAAVTTEPSPSSETTAATEETKPVETTAPATEATTAATTQATEGS